MLLGVVFHAALCLWPTLPLHDWPVRDPAGGAFYGVLAVALHAVRMPVFFFVSGLLTGLACRRRGLGPVARSRLRRIGWPLLVGLALLVPFAPLADDFAWRMIDESRPGTPGLRSLRRHFETHTPLEWVDPSHLWFLEFLLIYIGCAVVASRAQVGRSLAAKGAKAWRVAASQWGGWGLAALLGACVLPLAWHSGSTFVQTPRQVLPPWHVLAFYGVWYAAGWAASDAPDLLLRLFRRPRLVALIGVMASGALAWRGLHADGAERWACMVALPFLVAATVLSTVQACARLTNPTGPVMRLLADASYWVYLWHLPIIMVLYPLLMRVDVPAWVRFGVVMVAAAGAPLLTFAAFVRGTRLGALLGARSREPSHPPQDR
jgi:glucan biosynthesis protein C